MNNRPESTVEKRRAKRIIRTVLSLVLVFTMMLGLCSCAFFKKAFSKPHTYFQYVEEENISSGIDSVLNTYTNIRNNVTTTEQAAKATLQVRVGDQIKDLAETYGDLDISWVNDLIVSIGSNIKEDAMQADVSLALAKKAIATINMIADLEEEALYVSVPEFLENTLAIDFDDYGIDLSEYEDVKEKLKVLEALPEAKNIKKILDKYVAIVLKNITEAEKSSETLDVNGYEEDCTAIEVEISYVTLADICLDLIPAAVKDKDLEKLILDIDAMLSDMDVDADLEDLWDDFKDNAEDLVEDLEDEYDDLDDDTILTWTDYINGDSEIIGRHLEIETYGEKVEIFYGTAYENDEFGFEMSINVPYEGEILIEGEGSEKKGLIEGSFELSVMDEAMLIVDVENFDKEKLKEGYLNGMFEVSLSDELMSELDLDSSAFASMLGSAISFKFDVTSSSDVFNIAASLMAGKSEFFAIILNSEKEKSANIKAPTKDIVDDPEEWVEDLDIDTVLEKLEDAGIPNDVIDLITSGIESEY